MVTYTRRVQLTGGSTFIVSLPSRWVKETGLSKGSELVLEENNGVLTISNSQAKPREDTRILNVSGKPNLEYFQRVLTSIYIAGFDTLTIKSSSYIDSSTIEAISRFTRLVMGVEIFDESARSIVLQNVLDSSSFPVSNAVRRMSLNVQTMIEDTISGMENSDGDLLESVIGRDDDVDRYQLYVYREVQAGKNEQENGTFYLIFSRILERIADHAVNICKIWKNAGGTRNDGVSQLVGLLRESGKMYIEAVDAFYSKKFEVLNEIIGKKPKVVNGKSEILRAVTGERSAYTIVPASEEVVRIGLYATDIAELAMDMIVAGNEEFTI